MEVLLPEPEEELLLPELEPEEELEPEPEVELPEPEEELPEPEEESEPAGAFQSKVLPDSLIAFSTSAVLRPSFAAVSSMVCCALLPLNLRALSMPSAPVELRNLTNRE